MRRGRQGQRMKGQKSWERNPDPNPDPNPALNPDPDPDPNPDCEGWGAGVRPWRGQQRTAGP